MNCPYCRQPFSDESFQSTCRCHYAMLLAYGIDIILFIDFDSGQILEINDAAVSAYGYSRNELLSMSIYDLRADSDRPPVTSQMAQAFEKGILFEAFHRRKDGSTFAVEVRSNGATINREAHAYQYRAGHHPTPARRAIPAGEPD
jgi:PAS domain S-box-containing protein